MLRDFERAPHDNAARNHQRRAREAYISIQNVRGDAPVKPGTWTWIKLRDMQGWQRTSSAKAREHLFTLIGEKP